MCTVPIFRQALEQAQIIKPASLHTLRPSFATPLLEQGIDLCHIPRLMGHTSLRTTVRYIQVSPRHISQVNSPLDQWYPPDWNVRGFTPALHRHINGHPEEGALRSTTCGSCTSSPVPHRATITSLTLAILSSR